MKSEFFNHNSKPSYALMSTISGHDGQNYNPRSVQGRSPIPVLVQDNQDYAGLVFFRTDRNWSYKYILGDECSRMFYLIICLPRA